MPYTKYLQDTKKKISSEFSKRGKTIIRVLASFPRDKALNVKKKCATEIFSSCKTLIFTLRALVEKLKTTLDNYFWVFTAIKCSGLFKVTLQMATKPSGGSRERVRGC